MMVDKFKELFEELKTLREPLLHHLRLIENKKDIKISGETIFLSKNDLTNLLNLSNKYSSKLNIWHANECKDYFEILIIFFKLKDEKKR